MSISNRLLLCVVCFVVFSSWISQLDAEDTTADKNSSFQLTSFFAGCLYPVPDGEQWRLIDIEGNPVGDSAFDQYVQPFDNSFRYGYVSKDGKWYRIISTGKTFPLDLPDGYDLVLDAERGLLVLADKDRKDFNYLHVYNTVTGKFIGEGFFDPALFYGGENLLPIMVWKGEITNPETSSLAKVLEESTMNLLDLVTGEIILSSDENNQKYKGFRVSEGIISAYVSGIASGEPHNYTRFVDRNGEEIPIRPDERLAVGPFKNGVARCNFVDDNASRACLIDRAGRILCKGYKDISDNSDGLSRVIFGKENDNSIQPGRELYGFVNTLGEEIIPCQYYDASNFRNGMALVRKVDDMGVYLINTFGDELYQLHGLPKVDDFRFLEFLWNWKGGVFARIQRDDSKLQLININGTVIHETSVPFEVKSSLGNRYFSIRF